MKMLIRYINKKRAISPVIAVILLIGLAVAAVAAIFLVVLPLLEPSSNLEMTDAYVLYDDDYTQVLDAGEGYGKGTVVLSNAGTGEIEIESLEIFYSPTYGGNWAKINDSISIQDISPDNPFILDPTAFNVELTVRFPIPIENDDATVYYRMIVEASDGTKLDTTKETIVSETDMRIGKDRPDISFSGSLGTIRRVHTITPTVTDNSEIKNVTYEVATDSGFTNIVREKTILAALWRWQWDTFNDTTEGLDNGTYYMRITVYDYAGLSKSTYPSTSLQFTIDNDYVPPVIQSLVGSSSVHGPDLAEVGWFYLVEATITDSGSEASDIAEAFLYYKLNDTSTTYFSSSMMNPSGDIWKANIPAAFINSDALANNLTFYVLAEDDDENVATPSSADAGVIDTFKPDITAHIPVAPVDDTPEGPPITISVTVEDNDTVDLVTLVWREGNDTGLLRPDPWEVANYISREGDTWEFALPTANITVDGLDYYINASDPSGNVNDGSASSPYHITVYDKTDPDLAFDPVIASPTAPAADVTVRVEINDNDLSFSTFTYITATGSVKLSYKIDDGSFSTPFNMIHTSGDSSNLEDGIWEGTIKAGNFTELTTVTMRVEAVDQSGQSNSIQTAVDVAKAGTPIFRYIPECVVSGASSHILSFDMKNDATGDTAANAIIENITVSLYVNTKGSYIGNPLLIQIDASGTGIGGTNPRWTNSSTPSEGTNESEIVLTNSIAVDIQETATITLIYANSSEGYFNVNDLTVVVKVGFTYASGTSDGYSDPDEATFNTPVTAFQTYTQTRYFRSDSTIVNGFSAYKLDITQSNTFQSLNERTDRGTGSLTCTWSVRIYLRHSDSSQTELTSGKSAQVSRTNDGYGIQSNTWHCNGYDIEPTDAIIIEVYMDIGSYSYGPVAFITEQLGAEELVEDDWTIMYYTERDYTGFPQYRTRGIFYWGDSAHNSRITNFKFKALQGGASSNIYYSVEETIYDKPLIPIISKESKSLETLLQVSLRSKVPKEAIIILSKEYK